MSPLKTPKYFKSKASLSLLGFTLVSSAIFEGNLEFFVGKKVVV
jgi:hypothetical protein